MGFFDEAGEDITVPVGQLAKPAPDGAHHACSRCGKLHGGNFRHAPKVKDHSHRDRYGPVGRSAKARKRLRKAHEEAAAEKEVLPEPVVLQHGNLVVKTKAPWAWKAGKGGIPKSVVA